MFEVNKKNFKLTTFGFTLIELLAVIIILAIVALIATPIILNVIEDARNSANMSQANLVLDGAELFYGKDLLTGTNKDKFDGETDVYSLIDMTNKKPEYGKVYIQEDGKVSLAVFIDGKCYEKDFLEDTIQINENVTEALNCAPKTELTDDEAKEIIKQKTLEYVTSKPDEYFTIDGNISCIQIEILLNEGLITQEFYDGLSDEIKNLTIEVTVVDENFVVNLVNSCRPEFVNDLPNIKLVYTSTSSEIGEKRKREYGYYSFPPSESSNELCLHLRECYKVPEFEEEYYSNIKYYDSYEFEIEDDDDLFKYGNGLYTALSFEVQVDDKTNPYSEIRFILSAPYKHTYTRDGYIHKYDLEYMSVIYREDRRQFTFQLTTEQLDKLNNYYLSTRPSEDYPWGGFRYLFMIKAYDGDGGISEIVIDFNADFNMFELVY